MKYETCYNIDKPSKRYAKTAKHKRSQIICFHLYKISRISESIEVVSISVVTWGWRRGSTGTNCLMSMGAFFGDNENVTELERCDECTTL